MLRSLGLLLAVSAVSVYSSCVDGVDNVIHIHDTSNGKGKLIFRDVEVWTYDKDKEPSCVDGKPEFRLPGHFKLAKGSVEVIEGIKDNSGEPLELSLTVEKNSFMIGTVCKKGKSQNQFVPDAVCKFELCKLATDACSLLKFKSPGPFDLTQLPNYKDLIDIGALPIPQLGGEWQIKVDIVQGKKTLAGIRIGKNSEWLTIESTTELGLGGEIKYSPLPGVPPGSPPPPHHSEL